MKYKKIVSALICLAVVFIFSFAEADSADFENEEIKIELTEETDGDEIFLFEIPEEESALGASTWKVGSYRTINYPKYGTYTKMKGEKWYAYTGSDTKDNRQLAYCLQPDKNGPDTGTSGSVTDAGTRTSRFLYYAYGYPGYSEIEDYIEDTMDGLFKADSSNMKYLISHILLGMAYYGDTSDSSKAFYGISSGSDDGYTLNGSKYATDRANFRKVYNKIMDLTHPDDLTSDTVKLKRYGSSYSNVSTLALDGADDWYFNAGESKKISINGYESSVNSWYTNWYATPSIKVVCGDADKVSAYVPIGGKIAIERNGNVLVRNREVNGETSDYVDDENGKTMLKNGDWFRILVPHDYEESANFLSYKYKSQNGSFKAKKITFGSSVQQITFASDEDSSYATLKMSLPVFSFNVYKYISPYACEGNFTYENPNYVLSDVLYKAVCAYSDCNLSYEAVLSTEYDSTQGRGKGLKGSFTGMRYGTYTITETGIGNSKGVNLNDEDAITVSYWGGCSDGSVPEGAESFSSGNGYYTVPCIENKGKTFKGSIKIYKKDSETKEIKSQAGGSNLTAEFKVNYYTLEANQLEENGESISQGTPFASWNIKTNSSGYADLTSPFEDGIPLGVITITEVTPPEGYQKSSEVKVINISEERSDSPSLFQNTYDFYDEIYRGNVTFTKKTGTTVMGNVIFKLTNTDTGEYHYIATDNNGVYNSYSRATAAAGASKYEAEKNGMDSAVTSSGVTESEIDVAAFAFFGEGNSGETGTLIYGNYKLEEVPCPANAGYMLAPSVTFSVTSDGQVVLAGTVNNTKVNISTKAQVSSTGKTSAYAAGTVTLKDTVTYSNATKGTKYTIYTKVMNTSTGKQIGSTKTTTFTASKTSGTVTTTIDIPSSLTAELKGGKVTIYESIYCTDSYGNFRAVGSEETLTNTSQQVSFVSPAITTVLKEKSTGSKSILPINVTLTDTVSYTGFISGLSVTVTGKLVDKDSGNQIGSTVTKTFTPSSSSGKFTMDFNVDASELKGKKVVCCETVKYSNQTVAEESSLSNENQSMTVSNPSCDTLLLEKNTGGKEVYGNVTLTDTITYSGFVSGLTYTAEGYLVDSKTGNKVGSSVSKSFYASDSGGSVTMDFNIDTADIDSEELVAYETVYYGDEIICTHKDINSENQSVKISEQYELPLTGGSNTRREMIIVLLGLIINMAVYISLKERSRKMD